MTALCLGRFGDRRLEKGGRFFWGVFWLVAAAGFAFAGSASLGPERSA